MSRICKLNKYMISNFISSMKTQDTFSTEIYNVRTAIDTVSIAFNNFSNHAREQLNDAEAAAGKALDACERAGSGTSRAKALYEYCRKKRTELDRLSDNIRTYYHYAEQAMKAIEDCENVLKEHIKTITDQANSAQEALCEAMAENECFPAMGNIDGEADIEGLRSYCYTLDYDISDCQKRLDKLRHSCAELNVSWNDSVYRHFNGIVNNEIASRIRSTVREINRIKNGVEQMCDALEEYYDSYVGVEEKEIYLDFHYTDLEGAMSGYESRTIRL